MKQHLLVMATVALAAAAATIVQAAGPKSETSVGPAAYARLKTLVGEWEANTEMTGKVHLSYELIAGGTSLVERESSDKMPVMITVYYLDGDRLLLTHYCGAGNQPRMQARAFNPETGEVDFDFLDATNLQPGGGHMHNARIRVPGNDHFSDEWDFYENGQRKVTDAAQYTRVK
jgi:hypothetical protein